MNEDTLAIASVPMQKWGGVYEDSEALKTGTIFPELNKPFYAAETDTKFPVTEAAPKSQEQREREELCSKLLEISFVLDDLTLYLDTHMQDEPAMELYRKKAQERDRMKKEFAEKFYPLTRDCILYGKQEADFIWQDGPMPWEGACV